MALNKSVEQYVVDAYGLKAMMRQVAYSAVRAAHGVANGKELSEEGAALIGIFRLTRHEVETAMWSEKQKVTVADWLAEVDKAIKYYDTPKEVVDDGINVLKVEEVAGQTHTKADKLIAAARERLAQMRVPFKDHEAAIHKLLLEEPWVLDWDNCLEVLTKEAPGMHLKLMLAVSDSLAMGGAMMSEGQVKFLQKFNPNQYGRMIKCRDELELLNDDIKTFYGENIDAIGEEITRGRFPQWELDRLGLALEDDEEEKEAA